MRTAYHTILQLRREAMAREEIAAQDAVRAIRQLLGRDIPPAVRAVLHVGLTPGLWHPTAAEVAHRLGRNPNTVPAAFCRSAQRHGFAPDRLGVSTLLASLWLIRAAAVLEDPRLSVVQALPVLGAPSAQSVSRTIRRRTGGSAETWRAQRSGDSMLSAVLSEWDALRIALLDVRLWPRRPDAPGPHG